MRAPLPVLLLCVACLRPGTLPGRGGDKVRHDTGPADPQGADAAELGHEIFGLMDKVMEYKSSHFGNLPVSLPAMGMDSLTRGTIRRLTIADAVPTLTVVYRRAEGHALVSCSGTNKVLEDSMLNSGPFEVTCTLPSGETKPFTVGG